MPTTLRKTNYLSLSNPLIIGLITGLYPFLFYTSNNYFAVNSTGHFLFFFGFFIGIPILVFVLFYLFTKKINFLKKHKTQILFVLILFTTAFFASYASTLLIKKKFLFSILLVSVALSFKFLHTYKKVLLLILIMSVLPIFKLGIKIVDTFRADTIIATYNQVKQITFKTTPNIYMIQPDGYVSKQVMEDSLYNFKNSFYDWLESKEYKLYPSFRSNYPASLPSNASLFLMKQHLFFNMTSPDLEMPRAREIISGNNPVIKTFKNNGYKTYLIVQDDYFQQNHCKQLYDYTNIDIKDLPYFSSGGENRADVYNDFKKAFADKTDSPRFFFIEKLLPHHVHFSGEAKNRKEREREEYLAKIKEVNSWLKEMLNFISKNDPNALVIVLADHGGWVGIESYNEMFQTKNKAKINSIFGNLAAIKWNGYLNDNQDAQLISNVNVFKIVFSVLSKDKSLLQTTEDNSSYNLLIDGYFSKKVNRVIN